MPSPPVCSEYAWDSVMRRLRQVVDEYVADGSGLTEAIDVVRRNYDVLPVSLPGAILGTAPGAILVYLCLSLLLSLIILGTPLYLALSIPSRLIIPGFVVAGLTGLNSKARTGAGLLAYSIGLSLSYLAVYGYIAGLLSLYTKPLVENAFFHATLVVLDTVYLFKTRRYIMKKLEAVGEKRRG